MSEIKPDSILKLAMLNLLFWSFDMACAIAGFYFGFGITVKSWPALIGFMLLARWVIYVARGMYEIHKQKVARQ